MKRRLVLIASALVALGGSACSTGTVVPPGYNSAEYKGPDAAKQADLSFIPPTDPRYSENGAPRAGEPTGTSIAGDPRLFANGATYAPIYHRYHYQ
ncbi:MAG TPA: hypothetical protein VMB81_26480 [Candidatus Sulfotelmatobacter sp.]|nr:hypothetical protein [Candidatus Sulfotelmatobacter sp.]